MENVAISFTHKTALPVSKDAKLEVIKQFGFEALSDLRSEATKNNTDAAARAKAAAEKLQSLRTYHESVIKVPDAANTPADQLQEVLNYTAKTLTDYTVRALVRKGEELKTEYFYNILDLAGAGDEEDDEDGEYQKDVLAESFVAYTKAKGHKPEIARIAALAILGSKGKMLGERAAFPIMEKFQVGFSTWASQALETAAFDSIVFWMKRQDKRLKSAIATPVFSAESVGLSDAAF